MTCETRKRRGVQRSQYERCNIPNLLTEHDVLGRSGLVPEIQEAVVHSVDEELGAAGARLAGVGLFKYIWYLHDKLVLNLANNKNKQNAHHGESSGLVTDLGAVRLLELVGDASLAVAGHSALAGDVVLGASSRSAGTSSVGVGVSGVRAAELVHEVGNHTVEVETVVEASLGEVNEVVCCKNGEYQHRQRSCKIFCET